MIYIQLFLVRIISSLAFKSAKRIAKKRKLPKQEFLIKQVRHSVGYSVLYPLIFYLAVCLTGVLWPEIQDTVKNTLVLFWVIRTFFLET